MTLGDNFWQQAQECQPEHVWWYATKRKQPAMPSAISSKCPKRWNV